MKAKKALLIAVAISLSVSVLYGCGKEKENGTAAGKGEYGTVNGGKPITINCDLNNYLPSLNDKATEEAPIVFRSIQKIADEFIKIYPNVKIEWDRTKQSVGDWSQWMTTQLSSDSAPDIVMLHGAEYADRGWYIRLNEILEEPNVFIKGNTRWRDTFPEYVFNSSMTIDAKGNIVAVPYVLYPGTATAYYYNKTIFKNLNLEVPKTWDEFITVSKKINAAGYTAVGPWSLNKQINVNLWDVQFSLGPMYAAKIKNQWDYNNDSVMTPDELARATYEGVFNASSNPAVMDLYKQIKIKYTEILDKGVESTDYEALWTEGKVAMMEDGLWRIPQEEANTKRQFEYGMFPAPVISSKSSAYVEDIKFEKGPYQPPVAESYNIVKSTIERKGEGAKEAAIRFLQFITTPENLDLVVFEKHGESIGAVKGTQIPPELENWFKSEFPRLPSASWVTGPTVDSQSRMSRQLEMWIKGMIGDDQFKANYDKELKAGITEQVTALGIDTSGWKQK